MPTKWSRKVVLIGVAAAAIAATSVAAGAAGFIHSSETGKGFHPEPISSPADAASAALGLTATVQNLGGQPKVVLVRSISGSDLPAFGLAAPYPHESSTLVVVKGHFDVSSWPGTGPGSKNRWDYLTYVFDNANGMAYDMSAGDGRIMERVLNPSKRITNPPSGPVLPLPPSPNQPEPTATVP